MILIKYLSRNSEVGAGGKVELVSALTVKKLGGIP